MSRSILMPAFLAGFACTVFAQQMSPNQWIGKYHHRNDIGKEYFMLGIYPDGERLTAKYKEMITAQTTRKLTATVVVNGNVASFIFEDCLPLTASEIDEGGRNECNEYKKGDLILKVRGLVSGRTVSLRPLAGKLTRAGFAGEIYFVRTKRLLDSF